MLEGTGVSALQAGFVADQELECGALRKVVVGAGERGDGRVFDFIVVELGLSFHHFLFEEVGFDGPEAALAPFGGDHFFDEIELDLALRLELMDVGVEVC